MTRFILVCAHVFASFRNRGIAFPSLRCYYAICPGTEAHAVFPRESVPGNRNKDTEKRFPCALFLFLSFSLEEFICECRHAVYGQNSPCRKNFKRRYNCVQKQENAVGRKITEETNAFAGRASEGRRRTRGGRRNTREPGAKKKAEM